MSKEIITVKKLNMSYGKDKILKNVNMAIHQGDIYGFVGQNGSGKTTTMKIILSLINADSGEVSLFGKHSEKDVRNLLERVGSVVENPAFYPYLSGEDNLIYYGKLKGISDKNQIKDALNTVGLGKAGKKKFKNYSLGMKQRLGLGLAILNHPDILILDEPLNGLDPQGIVEFRQTLLNLNKELGVTIIISSHILDELAHIATTYGFIHHGSILEEISAKELQQKSQKYILLKVTDTKKAVFVLEEQLGLKDYLVLDSQRIKLFEQVEETQNILTHLVQNQVEVIELEKKGRSLEDYFIDLINGGADNAKYHQG